ncbi:MAG: hypothetical protein KA998_04090 [Rickettsiaceae bacterium]|nr:hypothetical protein [Rickettsiaceae bacterium]
MKKIILIGALATATSSAFASSAIASNGMELKLGGLLYFESGIRVSQSKVPSDQKNVSANRKKFAFDGEANFSVTASNKVNDFTYGARIDVKTSTQSKSSASYNGSHIFLTSDDYGKLELGSGRSAFETMSMDAFDVAAGCGNWDRYVASTTGVPVETNPAQNSSGEFTYGAENPRKITYYTPKFRDMVQFGISYTPDTSNVGIGAMNTDSTAGDLRRSNFGKTADAAAAVPPVLGNVPDVYTQYTDQRTAKDLISYAVNFSHHIADDTDIQLSISGERSATTQNGKKKTNLDQNGAYINQAIVAAVPAAGGAAVPVNPTDANSVTTYKLSRYSAWSIGTVLDYGNLSLGTGYTEKKGFAFKEVDGTCNKETYYNAGIAYKIGDAKVSFVYSMEKKSRNETDGYTFGTEYNLAPGLKPYAEFTYFRGSGKKLDLYRDNTVYRTKGTIAVLGLVVKF